MVMYSLYNGKNFIGKYVRKDEVLNEILDFYELGNDVEIFKNFDENKYLFVKNGKIVDEYRREREDVYWRMWLEMLKELLKL